MPAWLSHFVGRVDRINPAAQNGSRSYSVYIAVDNTTGQLKSGMFAQGQIALLRANALTVPATAIHTVGSRRFVYILKEGKLAEQDVTLGRVPVMRLMRLLKLHLVCPMVIKWCLDLGVLKVGVDVQVVAENAGAAESTAEAKP